MAFSYTVRQQMLQQLGAEQYDLIIIGGGINGAGIAREAALRGYRVALFEMDDFAFGTSSRSSRLIHGGLRYLEQAEVGLVFESVSERSRLSHFGRHLARPLPFIFPAYRDADSFFENLFVANLGLWIYDALALFRNYKNHKLHTAATLARMLPGLRREGLIGGLLYYDYQTHDARLVLENILAAHELGAKPLSYAPVVGMVEEDGRIVGVRVRDRLTADEYSARGHAVICAAGPWTDEVHDLTEKKSRPWIRATKGVHVVIPGDRLSLEAALLMRHPGDDRVLFALPYYERSVIGTTDTDFEGDPATVGTDAEDVEYLLAAGNHYFPEADLTPDDVISTWAGLRPLLDPGEDADPSDVSREHEIEVREDGLVTIAGGKLTTYRRMAEECVDAASEAIEAGGGPEPKPAADSHKKPLPGAERLESDRDLDKLADRLGRQIGDEAIGEHLALTYGSRARQVLERTREHPELAERVIDELPYIAAELYHVVEEEMALTPHDVLVRRTLLNNRARCQGLSVLEVAIDALAGQLGWDEAERERQAESFRAFVETEGRWRAELAEE